MLSERHAERIARAEAGWHNDDDDRPNHPPYLWPVQSPMERRAERAQHPTGPSVA